MPTALLTGASRGLGRALAKALANRGWSLIIDARGAGDLAATVRELPADTVQIHGLVGDVTQPDHLDELGRALAQAGPVELVINNASRLGPSPLPSLDDLEPAELQRVLDTNVVAPLAVYQRARPHLTEGAMLINISSDAAVEPYEGWGAYGPSKAALDHLTAILAAERPDLAVYAVDPGDMRTRMHQDAFPDEDISDRPLPEEVVPAFLALLDTRPPSGRYVAADLETAVT